MNKEKKTTKWGEKYIKKPPKIRRKIKRKWLAYLIMYIIGYVISLCITGIPSLTYLIPLKLDALFVSVFMGESITAPPVDLKNTLDARWRGVVFAVILFLLEGVFFLLLTMLLKFNIITDIKPFEGIFALLDKH
ncbi:hypothetical protein [Clostridium sp. JS66]|uniref:hypothetical protein n=1 Tax=Clostridium sp. JS66 TaxID=3064705 RepID=UPI00298E9A53|nr:hypothetical protein [Clostridium sp. JS66]WPC43866.1 hypothetical protein Q6H37_10425 [Clostridium sp. JS66]